MKILWLSPRWPLPMDSGARKATMALVEEIVPAAQRLRLEVKMNLVCLYEDQPSKTVIHQLESLTHTCDNLYLQKKPMPFGSLALSYLIEKLQFKKNPFTINRCTSSEIKNRFENWIKEKKWDYTIVDGLHGAAFADLNDPRFGKVIYRAHNVESDIWLQMSDKENRLFKKWALKNEYNLYKLYEKKSVIFLQKSLLFQSKTANAFLN